MRHHINLLHILSLCAQIQHLFYCYSAHKRFFLFLRDCSAKKIPSINFYFFIGSIQSVEGLNYISDSEPVSTDNSIGIVRLQRCRFFSTILSFPCLHLVFLKSCVAVHFRQTLCEDSDLQQQGSIMERRK